MYFEDYRWAYIFHPCFDTGVCQNRRNGQPLEGIETVMLEDGPRHLAESNKDRRCILEKVPCNANSVRLGAFKTSAINVNVKASEDDVFTCVRGSTINITLREIEWLREPDSYDVDMFINQVGGNAQFDGDEHHSAKVCTHLGFKAHLKDEALAAVLPGIKSFGFDKKGRSWGDLESQVDDSLVTIMKWDEDDPAAPLLNILCDSLAESHEINGSLENVRVGYCMIWEPKPSFNHFMLKKRKREKHGQSCLCSKAELNIRPKKDIS